MHPEVAALVAERELRSQHKYTQRWNKSDSSDEAAWTAHDRNHEKQLGIPYGICPLCHPEGD